MEEEIGKPAGGIWDALNTKGVSRRTEKKVKGKKPTFDWAIGWLAREDQIVIRPEKRSFRIQLRETQASAASASSD